MAKSETNMEKHKKIIQLYQSFDNLLNSGSLNFDERSKLIGEMARLQRVALKIERMSFSEVTKVTDDYLIDVPSKLNPA